MKKLLKWWNWLDNNILYLFLYIFIFLIPLYFKFPFIDIEYTYIYIRLEDLFVGVFYLLFVIQLIRGKVRLQTKFLLPVLLFWVSVFISFFVGHFILDTVPVFQLGFLHALRRVEYMTIFFVAMSLVTSKKILLRLLMLYITTVFLVSLYGIGQRLFDLPAVQTANPEYARGLILHLTPEARISSTFGGHFDLSAYMALSIPVTIGFYLYTKSKLALLVIALAISNLVYTVQRISFVAYAFTSTIFLFIVKRFLLFLFIVIVSGVMIFISGDLTERFAQTFQLKQIFVNKQTGSVDIDQTINVKELPAGNYEISLLKSKNQKSRSESEKKEIEALANKKALEEAKLKGISVNSAEFKNLVNQIASVIVIEDTILCDISCSTRLQVEWPRAIAAFISSPFFGTGASSLTEATDNDYLRWLGEFGAIGTILFLYILSAILVYHLKSRKRLDEKEKQLYLGFIFGVLALLINATYIDVFEASKVAFSFWLLAGIFTGYLLTIEKGKNIKS
ncbi:MAG: hypothetical protein WEC80_00940 [Patescibacteria group bacterium]